MMNSNKKSDDFTLEYDKIRQMDPEQRASEAASQLVLRPDFGSAEREAGMIGSADKTINRDAAIIMEAQKMKPSRRM